MRKSSYTNYSETLDIIKITDFDSKSDGEDESFCVISDTPTSPDPSESGAGPSGSIPDTPASPNPSGEFGPNSPSHQYEPESSESSQSECGSGSDLFVQIGLLDSNGNEVITGTTLSQAGKPFDLDELLPPFESVPNDVECLQYDNEKSHLHNECDESLP